MEGVLHKQGKMNTWQTEQADGVARHQEPEFTKEMSWMFVQPPYGGRRALHCPGQGKQQGGGSNPLPRGSRS